MNRERTSVGLDVHARSVVACGIDGDTGELFRARLCPQPEAVLDWLRELPGPVAVVYEAGPTGYGLARFLTGRDIACVVAAPSKLQRPSGDRVKTDVRDALHLARLLRLGEITPVAVPTVAQEAARDLVRAREDVRGDLMRARHRTTKLLLRQGIVWSGGTAWTAAHHDWLRRQRFDQPALAAAYDSALETVLLTADRRDRLDKGIFEMAAEPAWSPMVTRLQCLRGVSTLTAFGLAVEVGDWTRFTGSSIGAFLGLVPTEHSSGGSRSQGSITKDREQPRPPAAGRGGLAPQEALPGPVEGDTLPLGAGPGGGPGPRARRQPAATPTLAGLRGPQETAGRGERRGRPGTRRLVLVTRHPGRHQRGRTDARRPPLTRWSAGGPGGGQHVERTRL